MENIQVDMEILKEFERCLDPRRPDRSHVPARVLGYGEISTVFEIESSEMSGLAFKRLPIFESTGEMETYEAIYMEYNRLLRDEIGMGLPAYGCVRFVSERGRPVFFIVQKQLPAFSIGNRAIHELGEEDVYLLVTLVLRELKKVWDFNAGQDALEVAVDGQVSNWSIADFDPRRPGVSGDSTLLYLDTSTPLFRVGGVEQLDPELFLRSAPPFLAWILRKLFLADVIDRYYDMRRVTMDMIANFYKEQRPDLIPGITRRVNEFFAGEAAAFGVEPIDEKEVSAYYREDALIWVLYLNARRLDRFFRGRLLGREYPYILPGRIKR